VQHEGGTGAHVCHSDGITDIGLDEAASLTFERNEVVPSADAQVVNDGRLGTGGQQPLGDMAADESRAAGDDDSLAPNVQR
jgi:hypothetical protein